MTQLLFLVVFAEAFVAFLLMVKIGPLRELVMKGIDQVKMHKGTVLTIAATMSAILFSNWFSIVKIQNKGVKIGTMSPMDQVLWRTYLLDASLLALYLSSSDSICNLLSLKLACLLGVWFLVFKHVKKLNFGYRLIGWFEICADFDPFTYERVDVVSYYLKRLLFLVVFAEAFVAFLLMVKIGPLRELVMSGIDQVKMHKGTVLTIAATMSAILFSNWFSIVKIQNKGAKIGTMSPMDQVLWRTYLLDASLLGFSLYLGFLIDRMHHHLQKLINLRKNGGSSKQEVEKLTKEKLELQEKEQKAKEEVTRMQKEISKLTDTVQKLKLESKEKDEKVESAEAHVVSLQKQSADLLLEYDRLLEDNQILQAKALSYQG
ncbi:B-cell receptor-associated protein 31-like protein [Artemisia annua]|uniref:B-cell receptor-associated protein 31-like protein n=1 Tax=Artemisia annua TaxID=35608 RepID=A0A2U1Q510_ARTAN|nr:B-cell receptor-associated protein 31-like protein [Artemisia annua]